MEQGRVRVWDWCSSWRKEMARLPHAAPRTAGWTMRPARAPSAPACPCATAESQSGPPAARPLLHLLPSPSPTDSLLPNLSPHLQSPASPTQLRALESYDALLTYPKWLTPDAPDEDEGGDEEPGSASRPPRVKSPKPGDKRRNTGERAEKRKMLRSALSGGG